MLAFWFMLAFGECVSAAPASAGAAVTRAGGRPRGLRTCHRSSARAGKPRPSFFGSLGAGILATVLGLGFAAEAPAVTVGHGGTAEAGTGLSWIEAGAQPCAALCRPKWALDRMRSAMPQDVHAALSQRISTGRPMTPSGVVTGDVVAAVSFARAGVPLVKLTRSVAQFPLGVRLRAEGHAVQHGGREYRFVRVETWGNWALIVGDSSPADADRPSDGPIAIALAGSRGGAGGAAAAGGSAGGLGGDGTSPFAPFPTPPDTLRQPPSPMAPVPLPGGFALLAGALTLFAAVRRRGPSPGDRATPPRGSLPVSRIPLGRNFCAVQKRLLTQRSMTVI